jgi:hypothetical protein
MNWESQFISPCSVHKYEFFVSWQFLKYRFACTPTSYTCNPVNVYFMVVGRQVPVHRIRFEFFFFRTLKTYYFIVLLYCCIAVLCGPFSKRWLCKQRPLLANARNIHARNNRTTGLCNPFLNNGSINKFPRKRDAQSSTVTVKRGCFLCGPCQGVKKKTKGTIQFSCQLSVESLPVKRRLGGWCEMTASLGPSQ